MRFSAGAGRTTAPGARVVTTSMPSASKTASNARVYVLSRSLIRYLTVSLFHPVLAGEMSWSAGLVTRQGPSSLAW